MKVGFTGTQKGITQIQQLHLSKILVQLHSRGGNELHPGDCIGADAYSGMLAKKLDYKIILHPPINSNKRAWSDYDEARPVKEYLVRNHDIVDETNFLIATPKGEIEEVRSGAWQQFGMQKG